ncbi:hypothetical protein BTM25_02840 [Actinomadura rubteroloni]|uniref:SEFIR domain-containing protein n=1 Tax=Actinomadura rubteroloni TaxID=1926885 RepID=A0A2P4ULH5_9ACTN|nr:SEFIR domain-containing protein [Actinomadura rubteroloni]POM25900.1 hypothetical protein BTM25_02840 [Actinomadura rubteroloni]
MVGNDGVHVALTVLEEDGKWVGTASDGIAIGVVRLGNWQVQPVDAPKEARGGDDAYLVRINYELDLEPGFPPVEWLEVGFDFTAAAPVTVVDAVPFPTTGPRPATSYALGRYLNLLPSAGGSPADVHLPATTGVIDVFGIGGQKVRWRHRAEGDEAVRPGAHVVWAVLLVPVGTESLQVEFSARYDLRTGESFLPGQLPQPFSLDLRDPSAVRPALEPSAAVDGGEKKAGAPRVFISYAHDTRPHKLAARQLGALLARCGVDLHMDYLAPAARNDWFSWAIHQIKKADYIVILASPMCRAIGDGEITDGRHRGMQCESAIIRDVFYSDRAYWFPRLLPTVLPGESMENLPVYLQPYTADRYVVDEFSPEGIGDLLRAMGLTVPVGLPAASDATG